MNSKYAVCWHCDIIETVSDYVPEVCHLHEITLGKQVMFKLMFLRTLKEARQFVKGRKKYSENLNLNTKKEKTND